MLGSTVEYKVEDWTVLRQVYSQQDLVLHRGEIHSKLVGIMRERLLAALRQLPAVAARWVSLPPEGDFPPSSFSQNLAKQLRVLSQVRLRNLPRFKCETSMAWMRKPPCTKYAEN